MRHNNLFFIMLLGTSLDADSLDKVALNWPGRQSVHTGWAFAVPRP